MNEGIRRAEIGQQISAARKTKKITQGELAKLLGIRQATLSQLERGSVNPSYLRLEAIAEALGVPLSKITGRR